MKNLITIDTNIGHNNHRIFPASGTPDVARQSEVKFRIMGHLNTMPATDFFEDGDTLLFKDSTLRYDDVAGFVTPFEYATNNSSRESAKAFFDSLEKSAVA